TIRDNPRIAQPSVANAVYYWRHPHMGLYVPVTYTVWSVISSMAQVSGPDVPAGTLDARAFHATSLAFHLLNTLSVYWLLRRLLAREARNAWGDWAAAAGALLFGLHPVQVESVAWASGMKDVLCATFTLVALGQYLRFVELNRGASGAEAPRRTGRHWLHYTLGMA